ncbi:MAG: hypothetical protein RLZZ436_2029 [Planctomycetota bacterium]|jgi:hypothetical protein
MPCTLYPAGARPAACETTPQTLVKCILTEQVGLRIDRLVVRRTPDGLCLDGVIRIAEGETDLTDLIRAATGVSEVLNRLVVFREDPAMTPAAEPEATLSEAWQG